MRLRNKETGEIVEAKSCDSAAGIICIYYEEHDGQVGTKECFETLAELYDEWEDAEQTEAKRYRLLKDLPTFKSGDEFFTDEYGSLWLEQNICEQPNTSRVMAYHGKTIDKFPNILEEWFEEIKPAEPLIKNEKVRKAVRAWADAVGTTHAYLHIEHEEPSTFYVYNFGFECHFIQIAIHDKNPIEDERIYTITELCGKQE